MHHPFNFSAGPATLPIEVLQQAADEMLDWQGSGISVMEMGHRGPAFRSIHAQAQTDLRDLLEVPEHYRILFLQGGARGQQALIPMNLLGPCALEPRPSADYIVTGAWSQYAAREAQKYCDVHIAASTQASHFTRAPAWVEWQLSKEATYVHLCSNETIHGVEFFEIPQPTGAPMVVDVSSDILSKPIDISRYGVLYGGAQKNIGIAGLTLVIVREDLLNRALPTCPSVFEWKTQAQADSMANTPPTYAIYIAGLVFQWLKRQGGLAVIEAHNIEKAARLYQAIDASDFYWNKVEANARSRMNVPFYLAEAAREPDFLSGAQKAGLLHLKGHASVGGLRASIYNAVPLAAVQALVDYMKEFERRHA